MSVMESLGGYLKKTYDVMADMGLLLGSVGGDGRVNLMTIGWGLIGIVWFKPIFLVAVRKTRYTHKLMEETGVFTVNVPSEDMRRACEVCGTLSGRDVDKFEKTGLTWRPGDHVKAPVVDGCPIVYECRVVYKDDVDLPRLTKEIVESAYPAGNIHTLYYGEILKVHASP